MQVTFKTKSYDLNSEPQHSSMYDGANLLNLILTNVESIDELKSEATNCSEIVIKEEERVLYIYDDYTNLHKINETGDLVEICVSQPSMVQQLINLRKLVKDQAHTIQVQQEAIISLQQSQREQGDEITEIQEVLVEED